MKHSLSRLGTLLLAWVLPWLVPPLPEAVAQTDARKLELGIHSASLWLNGHEGTDAGVGGWIGYRLTPHFHVDGAFGIFPRQLMRLAEVCIPGQNICLKGPSLPAYSNSRVQGLLGLKTGARLGRVGVFGKVRPGFMLLRNQLQVVCVRAPCPPLSAVENSFALDIGGIVELYPSGRLLVRFDLGDTWISGKGTNLIPFAGTLGHNFQFNAGVGIRF